MSNIYLAIAKDKSLQVFLIKSYQEIELKKIFPTSIFLHHVKHFSGFKVFFSDQSLFKIPCGTIRNISYLDTIKNWEIVLIWIFILPVSHWTKLRCVFRFSVSQGNSFNFYQNLKQTFLWLNFHRIWAQKRIESSL